MDKSFSLKYLPLGEPVGGTFNSLLLQSYPLIAACIENTGFKPDKRTFTSPNQTLFFAFLNKVLFKGL